MSTSTQMSRSHIFPPSERPEPVLKGERGVEFCFGGCTLRIETQQSGPIGRVVVVDESGACAMMAMPSVLLEGVLRGALDSMGAEIVADTRKRGAA